MYLRVLLIIFLSTLVFSWFIIFLIVSSINSINNNNSSVKEISDPYTGYINTSAKWAFGSFVINNSRKCDQSSHVVKLLVLVHSSVTHFDFRQVIRKHNVIKNSLIIFLLGSPQDSTLQSLIECESKDYGDIVQADFYDTYRNLTLKHILGLTWAAKYCSGAQLVLKMDDDIFVNYKLLNQMLISRYPESKSDPLVTRTGHKVIICYIHHNMKVIRNETSRWFVSKTEYKDEYYPDFCSGWAYLTTIEVINDLLDKMGEQSKTFFWIDDIYITGIIRKTLPDIQLESLNKLFNIDINYLFNWATDKSLRIYKWRYVFSNANGDITLLSSALTLNNISVQRICCYPNARVLSKDNLLEYKPKNMNGFAKKISL